MRVSHCVTYLRWEPKLNTHFTRLFPRAIKSMGTRLYPLHCYIFILVRCTHKSHKSCTGHCSLTTGVVLDASNSVDVSIKTVHQLWKLTASESQHQHTYHTVMVSFGTGALKLGYSNKTAQRISLHEGLCQLDSHTELPRSQRMIPPTAAQSCTSFLAGSWLE